MPSFKLDAQTLQEVNAASSFLWVPPETAIRKGDTVSWTELVMVTSTVTAQDENNAQRMVTQVQFVVPPDAPPYEGEQVNARVGKTHTEYYRYAPLAIREAGHADRKMTVITLNSLRSLVRAANLLADGDDETDFGSFYEGDPPALVGLKVVARVREYKDKTGTMRMELGRFVSEGA